MLTVRVTRYKDRKNLVLWWRDPITDRVKTRSAGTHKQREAEREAARLENKLRANEVVDERITWNVFRERVEDEKLPGLADKSQEAYRTAMNVLEDLIDPNRLAAVGQPSTLALFVRRLRERGIRETTVATYLRHLGVILRWATRQNLLAHVPPMPTVRIGKRNSVMRGRPVTAEEFERMLAAVATMGWTEEHRPPWLRFLRGLWWSGLRLGESLAVSWDQDEPFAVDLSGQFPFFRIYSEAQKSRRDQLHPMAPELAEMLDTWPDDERHGPLFRLPHPIAGYPLPPVEVGKFVAAIGRKASIKTSADPVKYASAHDLRRSFGTRWAKKVRPNVLREMMRHRDIATTMTFYVREDADDLAEEIWATVGDAPTESETQATADCS